MVDKNLFLYDLAIAAIMKNEGHYLKEWLDYHLLAGVDHFYIYDNDSTDNQAEVARPYVEAGLVDYIPASGKIMQIPAYNDAVKNFKFQCRYMAFIDADEFIYPKTNRSLIEVVDEILSQDKNAAGLSIHWQIFGSNGLEKADYSRGVLERFTRRAEKDFWKCVQKEDGYSSKGNGFLKIVTNPRRVNEMRQHFAFYFEDFYSVNENGLKLQPNMGSYPIVAEKIVVNHYFSKSKEEFDLKHERGRTSVNGKWSATIFDDYDRNEVFDDGILKYRAVRAENFSLESDEQRFNLVIKTLTKILAAYASNEIFDLETALTCLALSTYLRKKFPDDNFKIYEEASLAAVLKSVEGASFAEAQLFIRELPKILRLPYPAVKEVRLVAAQIISQFMDDAKNKSNWTKFFELDYVREFLKE